MNQNPLLKAGILSLVLVILFLGGWEAYWRSKGYQITYDDGKELWSNKRAMVYQPQDKATVFIGSSRIKYDLDIPTWEKSTGEKAVQLAIEGNSPRPVLQDLADDEHFRGKLVIDVTEGLFFSNSPNDNTQPTEWGAYFKKQTPAQKFSYALQTALESKLVFLNKDYLSMNGMLSQVKIPKREKVFVMPYFPKEFSHITFQRQSIIEESFMTDTVLQNQVTGNWLFFAGLKKDAPPPRKTEMDSIFTMVKQCVAKIEQRGGKVIFVRTPSSGPFWEMEQQAFGTKLWQGLLQVTGAPGIHFKEYPETADYICPEWSHLSYADAKDYTVHLVRQLEAKGWSFRSRQSTTTLTSKL